VTSFDDNEDGDVFSEIIEGEHPEGEMYTALWTLVDGAIGEPIESFDEKYPHCLPASDLEEILDMQYCEIDDDCTSAGFTTCNQYYNECEDGAGATEYALE
jgi:hypothetical protein